MKMETTVCDGGRLWRFTPLDTLFFRDGRPFNAGESVWLESQFPPSSRTLQGAVRNAVMSRQQQQADYDPAHLIAVIGDAANLGGLRLSGPFLLRAGEWLLPAPLDVYGGGDKPFSLLTPANEPVNCDLGRLRLPSPRDTADKKKVKLIKTRYVTGKALADLLVGRTEELQLVNKQGSSVAGNLWPLFAEAADQLALATREPKVGLARDNQQRRYREGMLYSITLVRLHTEVSIAVLVQGLPREWEPAAPWMQALGGEGKLAEATVEEPPDWPAYPELQPEGDRIQFRLVFITPVRFATDGGWLPEGFNRADEAGVTVWRGTLNARTVQGEMLAIENMTIVSACLGDIVRIGGWDMVNNTPRPLQGFFPAGSVYFCEVPAERASIIKALHAGYTGEANEYGFGQLLIGRW